MYFHVYVLGSVHIRENLAYRKPLYLHILFSVQLSLLVNFVLHSSPLHLQNSVYETPNLLHCEEQKSLKILLYHIR